MDATEAGRLRSEILNDIGHLLHDELVAGQWGRALVQVVRAPAGEPMVAGIDVEEIVGDEGQVDAAFSSGAARSLLPTLAKATEALCAIEGVDLDDVGGGTFVRLRDGFGWLPGLVRTPSLDFDRERDVLVARMREKNEALRARFAPDGVDLDVEASILRWLARERVVGVARATLLGTFARGPRTWAWAWSNPNAAEAVRKASAAFTDALAERDLWEIATPVFATDEPTAWALAALLCDRAKADGVHRMAHEDGALFVLLQDARSA
ncbi:MAG TPA: hypothetical protein VN894_02480 [Polyangiaceae bacterium]|nr:hypothetical protein [Polyangiaceae bacterium]